MWSLARKSAPKDIESQKALPGSTQRSGEEAVLQCCLRHRTDEEYGSNPFQMLLSKVKMENEELCGEFSHNPVGTDGKYLRRQTENFRGDGLNSQRLPRGTEQNVESSATAASAEARKPPQTSTAVDVHLMCSAENTEDSQFLLLMMNLWNKCTIKVAKLLPQRTRSSAFDWSHTALLSSERVCGLKKC